MSAQQRWELQQALYERLTNELAGDGPGGADVAVYDHVPVDPARVHARIDGFNIVQRLIKSNKTLFSFNVHVFDKPTDQSSAARGQKTVAGLQEQVIAALHGWVPAITSTSPDTSVAGASAIRHDSSDIMPDEDGLTQHALSQFRVYIAAS